MRDPDNFDPGNPSGAETDWPWRTRRAWVACWVLAIVVGTFIAIDLDPGSWWG